MWSSQKGTQIRCSRLESKGSSLRSKGGIISGHDLNSRGNRSATLGLERTAGIPTSTLFSVHEDRALCVDDSNSQPTNGHLELSKKSRAWVN